MQAKLLRSIETSTAFPELKAIAIPAGEIFQTVPNLYTPYGPGMMPTNSEYQNIESPFPEAFVKNNPEIFEIITPSVDALSSEAKELLQTLEKIYDNVQNLRGELDLCSLATINIAKVLKESVE